MDIAAAKEFFANLISVAEILKTDQDLIPKWQKMLEQMPDYLINKDGALKEWAHNKLKDNYNHRHISHLYPV